MSGLLVWFYFSYVAKFKVVQAVPPEETPIRDFMKQAMFWTIRKLNHKKVTSIIPAYLKNQSPPIISYSYSSPIAPRDFNYKNVLQGLNTENITRTPSACFCKALEFCHSPAGHIIVGDLNIVRNSKLRDILSKGPKYRKPRSFT